VRAGLAFGVAGYLGTAAVDAWLGRLAFAEPAAGLCLAAALALSRRWPAPAGALGLGVVLSESLQGFAADGLKSGSGLVLPVLVSAAGLFLGERAALVAGALAAAGSIGAALLLGPYGPGPLPPDHLQRIVVILVTVGISAALTFVGVRSRRRALEGSERARLRLVAETTERRALEEQLLHAQRLETVGLLAGGVAHDFNNLLTAIGGNAELLVADPSPETRELAREILDAQRRGTALTRQLLAFARRDVRRPERLDLAATVREMERLLSRLLGERNRLELRAGGTVPVLVDRSQLEQVVVNLVTNARDASAPGAAVTVEVRRSASGEWPTGGAAPAAPHAVLTVQDRGAGMTAETRARIFEPFFTTKPRGQGTGLGLSTVHGIVAQSGGAVTVDSVPGAGTTFRVHLPLAPEVAPAEPAAAGPAAGPGAGERVLLVEDDPGVRTLLERALRAGGYDPVACASGVEALAVLDAPGARPRVLVTDMAMPGMSGVEVAGRIRERLPGLPVIFMTGYFEAAGAEDGEILRKPFGPEALLRRVREVLAAR